jgi:hypothetical protein
MTKRLVCTVALCASLAFAQATKPNFSGTWQVDPKNSTSKKTLKEKPGPDAPPAPPPPPLGMLAPMEIIQHREPVLKIIRRLPGGKPTMVIYSTDGNENVNQMVGGATEQRSKSHWDGEKLVTEWNLLREGAVFMHGRDVRWITLDGRRMIVHSTMEDSLSKSLVHTEWKKQPGLLLLQ